MNQAASTGPCHAPHIYFNPALSCGPLRTLTLTEHWNGTTWSVIPSPNPSTSLNFLAGVAATPRSGLTWAVGTFYNDSGSSQTLTEVHLPTQAGGL